MPIRSKICLIDPRRKYETVLGKKNINQAQSITFQCLVFLTIGFIVFCIKKLNQLDDTNTMIKIIQNEYSIDSLLETDNETSALIETLDVSHTFIVSAYYYPISKSLGQNAIAINMVMDSKNNHMHQDKHRIIGSNDSYSEVSEAKLYSKTVDYCRYATSVAVSNSVNHLTKLEIGADGQTFEIPFKMARYTSPQPVVFCISPQFLAEHWETFLLQVHVARRFGAHIHVYIVSIFNSFYELMKQYERIGYITIENWLKMKFHEPGGQFFEPNANTESGNLAGAYTDCLLQYKEAAEFITFLDSNDVLFPVNYPTYTQEFAAEFDKNEGVKTISYGRKVHQFVRAGSLSEFNFHDLISTLKSSVSKGSKPVIKPEFFNIIGIHENTNSFNRHFITTPSIIHVERPISKQELGELRQFWNFDFSPSQEKIQPGDIQALEEDFWRIRNMTTVAQLDGSLPGRDHLFTATSKCLADQRSEEQLCPNFEKCEIPQNAQKCLHTDANYYSSNHMAPYTYHLYSDAFLSETKECNF